MKKLLLLATTLSSLSITAQSVCDTVYVNGELFLHKDLSAELHLVTSHINTDEQTHSYADWAYYLSKPHPSVYTEVKYFRDAAQEFGVPVEILQAIGYVENNWTQMGPSIDQGWGIMHLVQNNYCNALHEAALLLNVTDNDLKENARLNIRGAAALIHKYANFRSGSTPRIEDWYNALKKYSGLISDELRTMQADRYYTVIADGAHSTTLWGEDIDLQKHTNIDFGYINAHYKAGAQTQAANGQRSSDYNPAVSSFTTCNYATGRTHTIDTWVNHWIGTGTAAGAVSWFQNCSAQVSAHFVVANNGTIYQVVPVANTAWHCGASGYPYNNSRSIGTEHEATVSNPSLWNSTAMVQASAQMSCYFCSQYGIATNQNHTSPGICGHQNMPGTNTDCPGTIPWSTWFSYFNNGSCSAQAPVQPANDYCGNATPLNVYGISCGATVSGDVNGATQSAAPTNCGGYTSANANDVWYTFIATATSHTITVVPSAGLDAVVDLRTACPGTSIDCADVGGGEGATETLQATGLIPGTTYYVRVYDYSGAANPPTTTTFTICVTTPCQTPSTPTINGSTTLCYGNNTILSISSPCSGCTYAWSNGATGTQTTISAGGTYQVTATNNCGTAASAAHTVTVIQLAPTISNLSNSYCLSGTDVTLTGSPSGGTFSGDIINSNTFSPSTAGVGTHYITYTVSANGCTDSVMQSTMVSSTPQVQITTNGNTTFCQGDSVTLTATQGDTYAWSNTLTTQAITISQSGSYTVTVTNPAGCTASVPSNNTISVTVNPLPIAMAGNNQTLILSPGNTVTIGGSPTANGGTPPYTYLWSPATGLNSSTASNPVVSNINDTTNYAVLVTDANGCTASGNTQVATIAPCTYNVHQSYFQFNAIGGTDSFYVDITGSNCSWDVAGCNWVHIISPALPSTNNAWVVFTIPTDTLSTASKTCTLTLTGGQQVTIMQQAPVTNPCSTPLPIPTIITNYCDMAAALIPNVTYQWYYNNTLIVNANTRFHSANQSGYYYVIIADSNYCSSQSADVYINYPICTGTGISNINAEDGFAIYPNPATDYVIATCQNFLPGMQIALYDISGRLISIYNMQAARQQINTAPLSNGIYWIELKQDGKMVSVKKLLK